MLHNLLSPESTFETNVFVYALTRMQLSESEKIHENASKCVCGQNPTNNRQSRQTLCFATRSERIMLAFSRNLCNSSITPRTIVTRELLNEVKWFVG